MPEPLLQMTGITKAFAGVPALADGNLVVQPGEVHAVVGQNGAGKSTLIKILTGVYRKDAGAVRWMGREVDLRSPREAQGAGIATIYQELTLVPQRTVIENIVLGYEPRTRFGMIDWRAAEARTRDVLARFGIDLDPHRALGSYPTAIQQLVAIGRAASMETRLLIMDEPTSSLDEREVAVLFEVIRALKAQGTSVLYVSHFLDEIFEICDGVTILRDGRTVGAARTADLTKLDLIAQMLGRSAEDIRNAGMTELAAIGRLEGGETVLQADGIATGRRLRKLDLTLRAGEIVGLAGLLGSGRTEAARALFGMDRLTAGEVRLAGGGRPTSPRAAIAAGLAFLSEDRKTEGIIPGLSVRENMTLALLPRLARMGVVDEARERRVVEGFIKALGIKAADMDQPIRELSGGNQQKVLFARALGSTAEIILMDDPMRGVDIGTKQEVYGMLRAEAEKGRTFLWYTTEMDELNHCDHVYVFRDGRIVVDMPRSELTEAKVLQSSFEAAA